MRNMIRKMRVVQPGTLNSQIVEVTYDLTDVTDEEILAAAYMEWMMRAGVEMRKEWPGDNRPPNKLVFSVRDGILMAGKPTTTIER